MLSIQKIGSVARTYRHIDRYQQILRVLLKYGFGDILETLGIDQYIEAGRRFFIGKKKRKRILPIEEKSHRPERVRQALEELGPTFIKLGQILSTRPDLIPIEFANELSRLQDNVPPFSYDQVRIIVHEETGTYPEDIFKEFEEKPIAAASIGQVHKARLKHSGEQVVVKVQRPKVQSLIEVDLEIMHYLAELAERHLVEMETHRPTRIIEEFARSLAREIDFNIEAGHVERFARQFEGLKEIRVPKVHRDFTTQRILTMEFIRGVKPSEIQELRVRGFDLTAIAKIGVDLFLRQIFEHGFFHADPHPGNLLIQSGPVICYLDFGMMGRISQKERQDFAEVLMRIVTKDDRKMIDALLKLMIFEEEPDRVALERDVTEVIDRYLYCRLEDIEVGPVFQNLLEISKTHKLHIKPNLFLMVKALSTMDGLGRRLDPKFKIAEHAEPFIRETFMSRYHPKTIGSDLVGSGLDFAELIRELPEDLRALVRDARKGNIKIQFEHRGIEELMHSVDRISNRVAFAIVLAALIIGSSLMVFSEIGPAWQNIPIIGLVGYLCAGVMALWLLFSILKGGKL